MKNNAKKIGKAIRKDDRTNWKIEILDDTSGDTGGFYLLKSQIDSSIGYDSWFEKKEHLEEYIEDHYSEVKWLDEEESKSSTLPSSDVPASN